MRKYLIISTTNDLIRIAPEQIVYISSDGNYSNIMQTDNESRLVSYQLGQIEQLLKTQLKGEDFLFIRIGRNLIINKMYIYYIQIARQKLILSNNSTFTHTVSASKEALRLLKDMLEKEVPNE